MIFTVLILVVLYLVPLLLTLALAVLFTRQEWRKGYLTVAEVAMLALLVVGAFTPLGNILGAVVCLQHLHNEYRLFDRRIITSRRWAEDQSASRLRGDS